MKLSNAEIEHIAWLARLELSNEEQGRLTGQVNQLMGHFEKLRDLDTTGVEPTSHSILVQNVFREDVVGECLSVEDALANAHDATDEYFAVPQVVEM